MRFFSSLIVLGLVGGVWSPASAQQVSGGLKGGVNFANLQVSEDPDEIPFDSRVGLVAGGFVTWTIGDRFSIQPEGLFSQKGAKFTVEGTEATVAIDYVEVPVLIRFSAPASDQTSIHVFAGPSLGFKARAKGTAEGTDVSDEEADLSDQVESVDVGLVVGAGIEIGRVTIDGRYTWGLRNLAKAVEELPAPDTKNRVFAILGGFRF
jgi:hypothetical protein